VDASHDETIAFELPQRLRQHLLADAAQTLSQA
jgi:hypothetical protein